MIERCKLCGDRKPDFSDLCDTCFELEMESRDLDYCKSDDLQQNTEGVVLQQNIKENINEVQD